VRLRWQIVRRLAFAVFAAYLILSLTFLFVALTPNPRLAMVKRSGSPAAVDEFKERRGLDAPLLERYRDWIISYTTFDWGRSYRTNTPVTTVVADALFATLRYVIPAMVIAVGGGLAIGLYTATHHQTLVDRLAMSAAHLGFSLPNFWLGTICLVVVFGPEGTVPELLGEGGTLLRSVILPAAVLTTSLLAGQLRYARAESLEYTNAAFIKLVQAKGARQWRVARHLLRNAAIPLFSLFFTDMMGILVLNIYVIEYVFGIPGLGRVSLTAIQTRDLPIILGTTMVVVLFGIVGNLLQDIGYSVLDPRRSE
jgi:peptide/nickel transport system permease protein